MLSVNAFCTNFSKRYISSMNCTNYVRKMKIMKEFLERSDCATADVHSSAKYVVTLDGRPLLAGNLGLWKLNLRMLSFHEIQEILGKQQIGLLKQKSMLLDVVDCSNQRCIPVYGFPLQTSNILNHSNTENHDEQLEEKLDGHFVPAYLAVMMLESDVERNLIAKMVAVMKWFQTYKYCPSCTTSLEISLTKLNASCTKCNEIYYPSISPVAICLVTNEANTHALLVRHTRNPKSVYTCIAGFAQIGESLTETVHREVAEEVGIECRNVMRIDMSQWWPFPNGSLMLAYNAVAEQSNELTICQEELQDAHWFSRDDIQKAYENTISDPAMKKYADEGNMKHKFHYIPPFGTISHRIIKRWLDETT